MRPPNAMNCSLFTLKSKQMFLNTSAFLSNVCEFENLLNLYVPVFFAGEFLENLCIF